MDSLSDIPDTPDFLPADSLNEVPTIWDVSTTSTTRDKVSFQGTSRGTLVTQVDREGWQSLRMMTVCSGLGYKGSYTPGWWAIPIALEAPTYPVSPHAPYWVPAVVCLLGTQVLPGENGKEFEFLLVSETGSHIAQSGLNFARLSLGYRSTCLSPLSPG